MIFSYYQPPNLIITFRLPKQRERLGTDAYAELAEEYLEVASRLSALLSEEPKDPRAG